ncbi:carboxypeptidase B-like [Dysidea avara]|uniref:carboxypeptidase B-like n=1 Tax=Dysidea avara TaxID=196820 RepID=UPI00331D14D0
MMRTTLVETLVLFLCFFLGALVCITSATYGRKQNYGDQVVVRCSNVSRVQYQAISTQPGMDIWYISNNNIDVRVSWENVMWLRQLGIHCTILHDSVEQLVKQFEKDLMVKQEWFEEYHEYDDIIKWYEELANRYTDIVTYYPSIGKSYEGRDMPAVHITGSTAPNIFKIYFQCQIHAREWISGAVCGYIVNYLLENYGNNDDVTKLLDSVEFIFIPFVNPDGYAYTWSNDRLWRKNRRSGSPCDGVDLNRNYDEHWSEGGSSSNPCSETYHGTGPESEPETQNTANYFRSNDVILGAIDWHSYSQLILRPYGWTSEDAPDEAQLKAIGDGMSDRIFAVHGKYYTSQKGIGLYPTSGTARDWFYSDNANVNNGDYRSAGYTLELRDTGQYGFLLPPDQIIPNGEEMVPAVMYFANTLLEDPIKK